MVPWYDFYEVCPKMMKNIHCAVPYTRVVSADCRPHPPWGGGWGAVGFYSHPPYLFARAGAREMQW